MFLQNRLTLGEPEEGSKRLEEFQTNRQLMVDIVLRIIRTRKGEEGTGKLAELPFIDSMMQNYSSEDKVVNFMQHDWVYTNSRMLQIVCDVITFMVGGFHTSGYLMTWLLWYLATNPASQKRLHEEIAREVGGDHGERLKAYALRANT